MNLLKSIFLIKKFLLPTIVSLQTIVVYSIIIIIFDYINIVKNCQTSNNIHNNSTTLIFFITFILILSINLIFKKIPKNIFILIILLFLSIIFIVLNSKIYSSLSSKNQEVKICSLSSSWGIQGKEITIYGQNFSPEWQPGSVLVNDFPLRIVNWTKNKITVEQPVPSSYFKGQLFVVNFDGVKSNSQPFEIINPDNLSKLDQFLIRYQFNKNK